MRTSVDRREDADAAFDGDSSFDLGRHGGRAGRVERPGTADREETGPGGGANPFRHWLLALNTACGLFVAGGLAAPLLAFVGWRAGAEGLYAAYHLACHQWAFRSFFVLGQQPLNVYSQQTLADLGTDPFTFIGNPEAGWKMAFCERDLAIYLGLLLVGVFYARHRDLRPAGFGLYAILILPIAVDGFTQLFGWRESTWQLRVVTGALFGLASAWLVLPRLDEALAPRSEARQYAPSAICEPLPHQSLRG
ncbi:MAG TPA: DUF2085 domain-containing protein [Chloroflexota bacterium]